MYCRMAVSLFCQPRLRGHYVICIVSQSTRLFRQFAAASDFTAEHCVF
jgi:hypothetical protein